jgi:uncharacterized protein DUF4154
MRRHAAAWLSGVLLLAGSAQAAAVVPFEVQVPLVLKALTYDRNLKTRTSDQVRIAVIVPGKGNRAADELSSSLKSATSKTINNLPVVFRDIVVETDADLEEGLRDGTWAAAYVMPGFGRADLAKIRRLCESRRVLAIAAAVDDVENGLAFGIGAQGSKPQIVINLPASKACGSDFDLALLQLSKVVH